MTDEALVRQLKAGDKTSFDLLYEKYKNMALRTAYLITGNLPDSEDVVQDTFVKVWLHCRELKKDGGADGGGAILLSGVQCQRDRGYAGRYGGDGQVKAVYRQKAAARKAG